MQVLCAASVVYSQTHVVGWMYSDEEVVLFCGAITFVGYHLCFYAMCLMGGGNLYDLWWCMMFCDHRGFKLK